ncbi:hypothetical protein PISMIDRAFT_18377 [Pisolithus microcarpus 441]|uniref:Unplaced genomic scaffold scaffold_353, whole genome shotgun sequence n=1 Tax=Pisolithus microcarpus 441 TaxID=765257 RepID=A0A0C9YG32_9AGAM|nr:hypothetical protein PISMIDRAFT_18377 [Pisolithus microcarpus 441]
MSNPPSASTAGLTRASATATTTATTSLSAKSSHASSHLYDIPSLDDEGSNFQTWKYRVEMILDVRGLWDIVGGTSTTAPDPNADPAGHAEWLLKDKEARAQITLTLKDEPLSGVLHATTAAQVWTKLCQRYEGKGKQTIAYLIGELFRGTLSDDSPMESQLNSMRQKAHILKSLGQPLDDSLIAIAMVISLPSSYATLRMILMSTDDKLSVDAVISQVLIEEKSQKATTGQSALTEKMSGQQRKAKDEKRKLKCTYCKKTGHIEEDCRRKKADEAAKTTASDEKNKANEKDKGELNAKVAHMSSDNTTYLQLFLANTLDMALDKHWIVDSGATSE